MPASVVRSKRDEADWERAKRLSIRQYGEIRYPVVMTIFQNMKRSRGTKKVTEDDDDDFLASLREIDLRLDKAWEEAKHPRGEGGRFTSAGGGGGKKPSSKAVISTPRKVHETQNYHSYIVPKSDGSFNVSVYHKQSGKAVHQKDYGSKNAANMAGKYHANLWERKKREGAAAAKRNLSEQVKRIPPIPTPPPPSQRQPSFRHGLRGAAHAAGRAFFQHMAQSMGMT